MYENQSISKYKFEDLEKIIRDLLISKCKKEGKKYVIGAVFKDSSETFYSFDLKTEELIMNPRVTMFFQENYTELIQAIDLMNNLTPPGISYYS